MSSRPPAPVTLEQTFAQLDDEAARLGRPRVRIQRADGSTIEGTLHSIEPTQLRVLGDANELIHVEASELRALHVEAARRGREWALAGVGILAATAALIGYAMLPIVRPTPGGILIGFVLVYLAATAVFVKLGLARWFKVWRPLYPPPGSELPAGPE